MADWKAVRIAVYLALAYEKRLVEEEMRKNPSLLRLKKEIEKLEEQQEMQVSRYKRELVDYDTKMRSIQDELVEGWNIDAKTFKCDVGSATMRTTRSLKIDNKEKLIIALQKMGKLTRTITTGWDLTYLRKLADSGLFDVDVGEMNIVHYDEKRNVIIHDVKRGGDSENEE
jgi:hypothetical protein